MKQNKPHTSIVSSSIRIFIIRFFSTLASLIMVIFFSHKLAPGYYGAYQNFWVHITVASSLGCMGLGLLIFNYPADTLRYLIRRLKPAWHFGYFGLLTFIGIIFTFLPQGDTPHSWQQSLLSFAFYLLYTICILQESFLIILKRFNLLTISSLIYAAAFVGSAVLVYHNGFRLETFIACLLPFLLLRSVMLFFPIYSFLKGKPEGRIMKPGLRNVQSLWMHLAFYDIITMLIIWFDKLIISFVATDETAAIYFNGSFNIPFLPIVLSAVSSATLIQLTHSSSPEDKARLMRQAGRVLSCAAYPLFFLLLIFRKEFVLTVFSEQYEASIPIFLCSIMILPVRAYSNTIVLQNLQKGKIMNIGVILDFVVAVALIVPLFKWIGLGGIALSFVISTYVQSLFYLYHSARLLQVPMLSLVPIKNWGLKAVFFASLAIALHLLLQHTTALTALSIAAVVCGMASAIILKIEMNRANTTNP